MMGGDRAGEETFFVEALVAAAVGAVAVLAGAEVAAMALGGHRRLPDAALPTAVTALGRLTSDPGEPGRAWPPADRRLLPGPAGYWAATGLVAVVLAVVATRVVLWWMSARAPGSRRVRHLGVDPRARLATVRELAPLVVSRRVAGRVIVGRVGRRLVATEDEGDWRRRLWVRRRRRRGGRSSVIVVGPSRCGKTSGLAIPAILEWDGPVLAVSVKADLMDNTLAARRAAGDVLIFDPRHSAVDQTACWSPLRTCDTLTGAMRTARALSRAAPKGGLDGGEFWLAAAEELLGPLLHAAALARVVMRDVVRWVVVQDGAGEGDSEIENVLAATTVDRHESERRRADAAQALASLKAIWALDPRTRDSVFLTARTMVKPWADPEVAASADRSDIDAAWLWQRSNTLYVSAPAHQQADLIPVFSGLVEEVLDAAYEAAAKAGGQLPRRLLVVLDEAANIAPLRELPRYASTCASHGIQLLTVWQDMAQIRERYGHAAETVVNNHATKVFCSGVSDIGTLEYVSRLLGEEEVTQVSHSGELRSPRETVSESAALHRLAPMDIIRQVAPDQAVLIHGTLRPAHLHLRPFYAERDLAALQAGPAARSRQASM